MEVSSVLALASSPKGPGRAAPGCVAWVEFSAGMRRAPDGQNEAAPVLPGPQRLKIVNLLALLARLLLAAAQQVQQHREQVEEVEIERQRAHDGGAFQHVAFHRAV